jgi:hypothetical protein
MVGSYGHVKERLGVVTDRKLLFLNSYENITS